MRNSTILKWANNNKNNKLSLGSSKNNDKGKTETVWSTRLKMRKKNLHHNFFYYLLFLGGNKNWIHSPDTLLNGHVVYLVKVMTK